MSAAACRADSCVCRFAQAAKPVGFDAELARRLEHRAQTGLDVGQPLRIQIDAADIVVQVGHGFADGDAGRFDLIDHALQAGIVRSSSRWPAELSR